MVLLQDALSTVGEASLFAGGSGKSIPHSVSRLTEAVLEASESAIRFEKGVIPLPEPLPEQAATTTGNSRPFDA